MKEYLGVDWGEKRIGLAVGNDEIKIATPFKIVANLEELLAVMEAEAVDSLVIGDPRKMSGAAANNPLWLDFMARLQKKSTCAVILLDERLSSLAADALPGTKKTKASRDEIAATLILQSYFDQAI
ncbi:MAG: Holliday junction resolvase RuvX [Patescibacteria group bacterium]|jgi:putative Holliday junction resolvase